MKETPFDQDDFKVVPVSVVEAMTRAEIDSAIATARRFPRNPREVRDAIRELATLDEETAASCFYSLPRGGKQITGPSIRLAEIVFSAYGNISCYSRVVSSVLEGPNKHVVVQAVCRDLQRNLAIGLEKPRRLVPKLKNKGRLDEDDIQLGTNAALAIVRRDAIFQIVPGIFVRPALDAARQVAIGSASTLNDRRAKCIVQFTKMGVSPAKVLAFVGKEDIADIGLEELENLIGAYTAIKDGTAQLDELFPEPGKKEPEKGGDGRPNFGAADPPAEEESK